MTSHPRFPGFQDDPDPMPAPRPRRKAAPEKDDKARSLLYRLIKERGTDYKAVSIAIGYNATYLSQYMAGTPASLPERAREALAAHFGLASPDLFRADAPAALAPPPTFRFLYRCGSGGGEVPEEEQFSYPAPPFAPPRSRGILAQVTDGHVNRVYPPGTVLWCASPADLGRPLRVGDRCLARLKPETGDATTHNDAADTARGEVRVLLVSLSADGYDIVLQSSTSERPHTLTVTLPRGTPQPGNPDAIRYHPTPLDPADIVAVVVAALRFET